MRLSPLVALIAISTFSVAACGDDADPPAADVADTDTAEPDGQTPDAPDVVDVADIHDTEDSLEDIAPGEVDEDAPLPDASEDVDPGDGGSSDGTDGGSSGDTSADASAPTEVQAVIGARCALSERFGLIEVEVGSWATPPPVYLSGWIRRGPPPDVGSPEATTELCAFHRQPTGCGPCALGEVCAVSGSCAPVPERWSGLEVRLTQGESEQVIGEDTWGDLWGEVTLPTGPLGLSIALGATVVTVPPANLPSALSEVEASLEGDYMTPEGLTVSWESGKADELVMTHIPMNHHVGGPTFTECQVAADVGALSAPGSMLQPLSLVTGLEFQGLTHGTFAAAEVPEGCLEVRFIQRTFVSPH